MADRTVLITGAGTRIGAALATGLVADGWHVIIHYFRSETYAKTLADALGNASIVQANLTVPQEVGSLIARAAMAAGRPLTALINNASTFVDDRADSFTNATFDHHMDVNLRAPIHLSRDFAAQLPAGAQGCIINMIDQRVFKPDPQFFTYGQSKGALLYATKTLAQALAPHVRVNGIGPGPTLRNQSQTEEQFAHEAGATLLGKGSPPETLLHGVRYLLGADAVTGQMIAIDGGQHLLWQTVDTWVGGANVT